MAAAGLPDPAEPFRLAIIAMGKAGGRELNYVSDVDVVFVAEPGESDDQAVDHDKALAAAARLAAETMRICRAVAWEVDAALRPEGKDGPLVRTLASHQAYYQRWASTWEFQALLKARPVAGDAELGERYRAAITPLVWTAAERPDFVADVQAMRRRVIANLPTAVAEREIKLGRGGLRDVEFAVQLLQLVHGRGDEALRVSATLPALDALRDGGYVGVDDAVSLIDAYRFLRETEHRLQLRRLRRTHVVPDDPAALLWLGRAMGYRPDARGRRPGRVGGRMGAARARGAPPAREAVLPTAAGRRSPGCRPKGCASRRPRPAAGWPRSASPTRAAALRHIESLTTGLSRRAALQRALLPVLLSEFADAPDPDGGLLAYRQVSDELGSTPWYLRLLRDEGAVASRLAHLLGTSRYVARMLGRAPEALQMLADDDELVPRDPAETLAAMAESAARQDDPARRGRGRARPAPPGAAAHRVRRPARAPGRRGCVPGHQRDDRGHPRRHAADRDPGGRGRARSSRTADPVRDHRDGPAGRRRDQLRLRRRRHVRATSRAAPTPRTSRPRGWPRTSPAGCGPCSMRRRRTTRRSGWTPTCGPRAATARWSARWRPTRRTTPAGPRRGRPRPCCGPASPPATTTWGSGSSP